MKADDLTKFKGELKTALQEWGETKIDELFPGKAAAKQFMKNGLHNILNRYDAQMNQRLEQFFVFVANDKGVIDSDVMVDTVAGIFKEINPAQQYNLGLVEMTVGDGKLCIHLPDNMFLNMLVGNKNTVTFTTDDILDFKNFFN